MRAPAGPPRSCRAWGGGGRSRRPRRAAPTSWARSQVLLPWPAQASSTRSPGPRAGQERHHLRALLLDDPRRARARQAAHVARAAHQDGARRDRARGRSPRRARPARARGIQAARSSPFARHRPIGGGTGPAARYAAAPARPSDRRSAPRSQPGAEATTASARAGRPGGDLGGEPAQDGVGEAAHPIAGRGARPLDRLGDRGEDGDPVEEGDGVRGHQEVGADARDRGRRPCAEASASRRWSRKPSARRTP